MVERLQKVLARSGLGSRRRCEELIAEGRVTVNGAVAALGDRADLARDAVAVDGVRLMTLPGLVTYALNKPEGVITSADDPRGRPLVVDLVPAVPRVFPVGRLDADSEGLLICTNDGDLAQLLAHPSHGVEKEYLAWVEGKPGRRVLAGLRRGVELDDGMTAPAVASIAGEGLIRITIHEGRNRQVRRMCAALGHPVRRLVRIRIGPLRLGSLAPGEWRALTASEVRALSMSASGAEPDPPGMHRYNRQS